MGTDSEAERVQLKFGVDRILSEEVGNAKSRESSYLNAETSCDWSSCGRCAALRCCIRHIPSANQFYQSHFFQPTMLHAPKPIRPFPAIMRDSDDRAVGGKRKRSWSRAVFSSLQRKGLEKRFQLQQYITKPDRRQLAATLGLTDAQVKVWFQNRRMKWRHTKEMKGPGVLTIQQRLSASAPTAGQGQTG